MASAPPYQGNPPPYSPSFGDPTNAQPVSSVEISVSCRNLYDADFFSKSDPMVVMFTQALGTKEWREFGRTEAIQNTLEPEFVRKFVIDYFFEERQHLRFDVYDIDSESPKLTDHDFLGSATCTLGEIVSASSTFKRSLKGHGRVMDKGEIILRGEEINQCKDTLEMGFNGKNLENKKWFSGLSPFLVFLRCNEDNRYTVCAKTEKTSGANPSWRRKEYSIQKLCNGDRDRTIKVEVYDYYSNGSHNLIGTFETSVNRLEHGVGNDNVYPLEHPKNKSKKSPGTIFLNFFKFHKNYSFLEYLRGGLDMNFVVAIDFTGSNGNPTQPSSLHYIHPQRPNQYSLAIQSVGGIIQDYDTDRMFPTYGFGARLPPSGQVSHNFAVNFDPNQPSCHGIDGVLAAYQSCIRSVQLYGPTNFSPIINNVAQMASDALQGEQRLSYFVLLMITDGIITDMEATKNAIVRASSLPLSIIIVGVGDADFEAMDELDGDDVRLESRGKKAVRDIVQFVPFMDYMKSGSSSVMSSARLAKAVLAEVPDQVTSYMKVNGIIPEQQPPLYR